MPVLSNALISTQRSTYSSTTGATSAATSTVLTSVSAHVGLVHASAFKMMPPAALTSDLEVQVDSGTDIRMEDVITAITLPDGVTPWPGLTLANTPIANETFRVVYIEESTPGPLKHRSAYIKRVEAGGVSY